MSWGSSRVERRFITKAGYPAIITIIHRPLRPSSGLECSWHCGYVGLKDHKLVGRDYDSVSELVSVHGGLTYADTELRLYSDDDSIITMGKGLYWFGFDCAHFGDKIAEWTLGRVIEECESLARQLYALR